MTLNRLQRLMVGLKTKNSNKQVLYYYKTYLLVKNNKTNVKSSDKNNSAN